MRVRRARGGREVSRASLACYPSQEERCRVAFLGLASVAVRILEASGFRILGSCGASGCWEAPSSLPFYWASLSFQANPNPHTPRPAARRGGFAAELRKRNVMVMGSR